MSDVDVLHNCTVQCSIIIVNGADPVKGAVCHPGPLDQTAQAHVHAENGATGKTVLHIAG
jgi:hypothetical protein